VYAKITERTSPILPDLFRKPVVLNGHLAAFDQDRFGRHFSIDRVTQLVNQFDISIIFALSQLLFALPSH
jgi:hypothetical protein